MCKVGPNMVTKKGGKEVEVQDGWVGHVLPVDLVQHTLLADDLDKLEQAESRASAIDPELAEILEGLSEDDKAALGDALSEAGDASSPPCSRRSSASSGATPTWRASQIRQAGFTRF